MRPSSSAIALGTSGTLYGGPLVAGSLLMPLFFGVIVHRTKQLPGWSPSYLYVLAVLLPIVGLLASQYGVTTFRMELALLVVLPSSGPWDCRSGSQIRKRLGW
ncbi:MAG: hypothetical protein U5K37_02740 [Natrialbaceae archaeon]|nr:hypothetical protein [Natrialbaceae archaeon]